MSRSAADPRRTVPSRARHSVCRLETSFSNVSASETGRRHAVAKKTDPAVQPVLSHFRGRATSVPGGRKPVDVIPRPRRQDERDWGKHPDGKPPAAETHDRSGRYRPRMGESFRTGHGQERLEPPRRESRCWRSCTDPRGAPERIPVAEGRTLLSKGCSCFPRSSSVPLG
jgi:hypothetical protein